MAQQISVIEAFLGDKFFQKKCLYEKLTHKSFGHSLQIRQGYHHQQEENLGKLILVSLLSPLMGGSFEAFGE